MHSTIVGGSTAKRVLACPGSVALAARMPPQPASSYADEGTLLHEVMAQVLMSDVPADALLGKRVGNATLTEELIDSKITPALAALDEISKTMMYEVETKLTFGDDMPGVFGSADVIGRDNDRAYVIDFKFGDGVAVDAEENEQLLFYAAAARHSAAWALSGVKEVELVIIQPPFVRRWTTDIKRLERFELDLKRAVAKAQAPDAPIAQGDHCRWCPAKPICPAHMQLTDRLTRGALKDLPADQIADYLRKAEAVEAFIKELRELAQRMLENGVDVPGWKMVSKRATRQWVRDEDETAALLGALGIDPFEQKLLSPAQAEKALKRLKTELPADMVTAVSSGDTLAPEHDPRPASHQLSRLKAALNKVV